MTSAPSATAGQGSGAASTTTAAASLPRPKKEFIVSPLFVHRDANDGPSYKKTVRLLSSVPGISGGDDEDWEVEASIEEFSSENTTGAKTAPARGGQKRRIAVRRPGNGELVSSFGLPPPATSTSSSSSLPWSPTAHPSGNGGDEDGKAKESILCWATFGGGRRRRNRCRTRRRRDRPLLCVLSDPTTLHVFDALPHRAVAPSRFTSTSSFGDDGSVDYDHDDDDDVAGGGGAEGHTVALPFEASAIFPVFSDADGVEGGGGLLIQRAVSVEDREAAFSEFVAATTPPATPGRDGGGVGRGDMMGDESPATRKDDGDHRGGEGEGTSEGHDEFLLRDPPRPVRRSRLSGDGEGGLSMMGSLSPPSSRPRRRGGRGRSSTGTACVGTSSFFSEGGESFGAVDATGMVPSLFTMTHPLEEVKPVALLSSGNDGNDDKAGTPPMRRHRRHFADAEERVVFVGSIRWTSSTTGPQQLGLGGICVTHNARLGRHAIWSLCVALPPPPASPPLWEAIATSRGGGTRGGESDTIDAAVAVATAATPSVVGGRRDLDPDSMDIDDRSSSRRGGGSTPMSTAEDAMMTSPMLSMQDPSPPPPSAPFSHFIDLHSELAVEFLFAEEPSSSPAPERQFGAAASSSRCRHAFLATDERGRGDLVLCLLCPNPDQGVGGDPNPFVLRRYCLVTDGTDDACGAIRGVSSLPEGDVTCLSAQPVQSTPVPPVIGGGGGLGGRTAPLANDILVCRFDADAMGGARSGHTTSLRLYRSGVRVVDCVLPVAALSDGPSDAALCIGGEDNGGDEFKVPDMFARVLCLENPVRDRIDLICAANDSEVRGPCDTFTVRVSVSLLISCSPISENALAAIESSLARLGTGLDGTSAAEFGDVLPGLALEIRADCARLAQAMFDGKNSHRGSAPNDYGWEALSTVVTALMGVAMSSEGELKDHHSTLPAATLGDDGDSASPWSQLLQSDYHLNYGEGQGRSLFHGFDTCLDAGDRISVAKRNDQGPGCLLSSTERISVLGDRAVTVMKFVFDALHLLYEDSKLMRNSRGISWLRSLGSLLMHLCMKVSSPKSEGEHVMADFIEHYCQDLPKWRSRIPSHIDSDHVVSKRITNFAIPPCIFSWIDFTIRGYTSDSDEDMKNFYFLCNKGEMNGACASSWIVLYLLSILFTGKSRGATASASLIEEDSDTKLVIAMLEHGVMHPTQFQDELPMGVSIPLTEALRRCRSDPPPLLSSNTNWPSAAYTLIGREDLATLQSTGKEGVNDAVGFGSDYTDKDGLVKLEFQSSMMFPDDNRIREATSLLRSSRPTYLRVPRAVEVSDHDYEKAKQEKLMLLCRRVLALPLGRGMLTLGTLKPLSVEPLLIPDIVLAGRVPPTNGTLALDVSNSPADFRVWPEFHNGVAAGLRLPSILSGSQDGASKISRTWIMYNKPAPISQQQQGNNAGGNSSRAAQPNHVHGGFLMALGLRGHLSALAVPDLTQYLQQGVVTTTVGILLGMAANRRGTCDPQVSKMLCLHLPSLLPSSFASMDLASTAQTAAAAGIGLLYQGSSHRLMTEFLLNEMGRHPTRDQGSYDREGYTLACGLALGMVNLSQGDQKNVGSSVGGSAGLSDLNVDERLYRYIVGGVDEQQQQRENTERSSGETERSSRIFDGDMINKDVTAPGATLALGLMYLRTENNAVASRLALPSTHFFLDYVRPDLLALRVVSRALILWDSVQPSSKWINDQVPDMIKKSMQYLRKTAEKAVASSGMPNLVQMKVDESVDTPNERREDDTTGSSAEHRDLPGVKMVPETTSINDAAFDWQAVRQAHANIVAGACFALGLRYAGTGDRTAYSAIFEQVMEFAKLRDGNDPVSLSLRPEKPILEMCICFSAIALSMVMSGTGDLDTLRLLRALRWRCDEGVRHGTHMAIGASIGLLFLGGGKCTLGRAPEDVAALLMAFYPHFPMTESDNQYHLQALRHMYVLAVKRRELEAVDIDTRERVPVPVEVFSANGTKSLSLRTPCLLPNNMSVSELKIASERYYPISLDVSDRNLNLPESQTLLFVKKRIGHLSYLQDPHALRSLLAQSGGKGGGSVHQHIKSFTEDSLLLAYAKYLCDNGGRGWTTRRRKKVEQTAMELAGQEFCAETVHECLTQEKPEALPFYFSLLISVASMDKDAWALRKIWDIRLVRSYYASNGRTGDTTARSLLSTEFVARICEHVDDALSRMDIDVSSVLSFVESGKRWNELDGNEANSLGCFFVWNEIPSKRK